MKESCNLTSKFINFLTKLTFIPIYVSKEEIVYKFFHWRTLLHLIIYIGIAVLPIPNTEFSLDYVKKRLLNISNPWMNIWKNFKCFSVWLNKSICSFSVVWNWFCQLQNYFCFAMAWNAWNLHWFSIQEVNLVKRSFKCL